MSGVDAYTDLYGLVEAARLGDRRAQDDLVAAYLPLVYNIVGRALSGHADVDDVVQETMLRAVDGLPQLRDPAAFRSWLVAIAMNQIRGRWQEQQARLAYQGQHDSHGSAGDLHSRDPFDVADPRLDFVELTIVRLGLSGQRREVAEATRWLDDDDRELLSLWWLEAAGELTRPELAAALGLSPQHAAVRIQRMKGQLELSRVVVRALITAPRCRELHGHTVGWDGTPSPLWRKRFARHVRDCGQCSGHGGDLVPAERLLVALGMVPPAAGLGALIAAARHAGMMHAAPAGYTAPAWAGGPGAPGGSLPPSARPGTPPSQAGPSGRQPDPQHPHAGRAAHHAHRAVRPDRGLRRITSRPLLTTAAAGITAIAAVAGVYYGTGGPAPDKARSTDSLEVTSTGPASTAPAVVPDPSQGPTTPAPTPTPQPSTTHPKPTPTTSTHTTPAVPPSSNAAAVQQVLDMINKARADNGLPPLTITAGLTRSASAHNAVMGSGCGMSHQCPGEPGLGARESAAGVQWSAAGENIGEGGPVSNTDQGIAGMATALTQDMLNEQPPNDGHRRNILSSTFTHIGIAVFRDSKGTVWMTQDFSD